jgi:hypothetical protein
MSVTDLDMATLRPASGTAEAIRAAIDRVDAKREDLRLHGASVAESMKTTLLDGSDAELDSLGIDSARCVRAQSRLDALRDQLQSELAGAERAEAVAHAIAARDRVASLTEAFVARWRKDYAQLAQGIAAILAAEAAIWQARQEAHQFENQHAEVLEGVDLPEWKNPGFELGRPALSALERGRLRMGDIVRLPNVFGEVSPRAEPPPFWAGSDRVQAGFDPVVFVLMRENEELRAQVAAQQGRRQGTT